MNTRPDKPINATVVGNNDIVLDQGLTKREYFAAMALSGMEGVAIGAEIKAKLSVRIADALIEELNKKRDE